jgi:amino acid adenylation domain-containing protein
MASAHSEDRSALMGVRQTKMPEGRAPITKRGESDHAPLSFVQERRWFLEQMRPHNPPNYAKAIRMTGYLDVRLLQETLDTIVARHEVLRTTFSELNGQRIQIVNESRSVNLAVFDLRASSKAEQESEIRWLLNEESQQTFNLSKDQVLRASLLLMSERDQVLILTVHRCAFDDTSFIVFLEELAAIYDGLSRGAATSLPSLPLQYSDYAQWERNQDKSSYFEGQVSYWKSILQDPRPSELPTDRPRPAVQTFAGKHQYLRIEDPLYSKLMTLIRQEPITLKALLLAGFSSLVHFYIGSDDITIGTSDELRPSDVSPLIGRFTNFLPLRFKLDRNSSARDLLRHVQRVLTDAYSHRDVPFAKLLESLQPERDLSRTPLFQVLFSMNALAAKSIKLSELTLIPLETHSRTSDFDLTLLAQETDEGILTTWEYNTDLFDDSTILRMMNHYRRLLENVVADPDARLLDWTYLTADEQQQLISDWNSNQADYPRDKCIHQLFEDQVDRTPDAVAVIFDDRRLTYRELNAHANQLAHYLRRLGVGPEVRVGICVERSVEMIISVLSVLKAGAAYVPLDPAYPQKRLAFMLEDSQALILLTQQRLVGELSGPRVEVVCLDKDWDQINREKTSNPALAVSSEDLAYIIYTSGSTGKPKGVAIEHRASVAFLSWATATFSLEQLKGVLASTSICFDLSVYEIFAPLSCGGSVVLAENILQLPNLKAAEEVSLINTVPSVITEFLRSNELPGSVRTINLAGEPLKTALVRQLYKLDTVKEVFDLYGPTEDTTYSTFTLRNTERATIGRPISNSQAYILDRHQHLVPIGVAGELHLGGAGLARGYLNRPELTAERFIPNPFSNDPSARLYKTGDLARYLPSGEIEYLGRMDNQVKIRGFRIELGEIEAVISEYPAVRESVVLAIEDRPDEKRLVAYIVEKQTPIARISELRSYLEHKLPAYMVPTAFVVLEKLPLTPNGKLDRKALPLPDWNGLQAHPSFIAPRDEIETELARIWESVLGHGSIGVRKNFFELGGNSLLAARMFSETNRVFNQNIPLAILFQGGTIEHLATLIRHNEQDELKAEWSSLVTIQPDGSKPPFFCVHGIGGNVLTYTTLARYLGPDQPFYGLQSAGLDGRQIPHTKVEQMAAHYIKVISDLQPQGPYLLGGLSFGGIVAFEMARQLQRQGRRVACVALLDSWPQSTSDDFKLTQRIELHLTNLRHLSLTDRLTYFGKMAKTARRKLKSRIWRVGHQWYRDHQDQLPAALRNIYEINYQAAREYVMQPYSGSVTLFRASDNSALDGEDDLFGWDKFATGVDLYRVPGDHVSMMNEPHVQVLAEQLKRCLARASSIVDAPESGREEAIAVA